MDKNQVTQIMSELVNVIKVREHIYTIVNGPRTQLVSKDEERDLRQFANQLDRHVVDASLAIKRGLEAQQQVGQMVTVTSPEVVTPEPTSVTEPVPRKIVRVKPDVAPEKLTHAIPTEADAEKARHKAHRQAELIKQMQREMAEQDALVAAEDFEEEEPSLKHASKRKTRAKKESVSKSLDDE